MIFQKILHSGKGSVKVFRTIFITGMAFCVNYGINLILTPFITDNVGTEAYGFVSLAKQFAQYAMIITTALNSFAARHIAVSYHKNEKREANIFFSSVFYGDLGLGTVILTIALLCIFFLDKLINIPGSLVSDVKFLFLYIFINFWLVTVFNVFSVTAFIKNKLDLTGVYKGISYMTEAVVLLVIYVLFPAKVCYVGLGIIAGTLVVAVTNKRICSKYTPDLVIKREFFSFKAVKRLVLDGIWTSVNSLGNLLNSGLDLIVCNLMLSSLEMGQLAIAKTIESICHALYQLVAQAFQPSFLKSYADGDKKKLLSELRFSMKICGMMSNLVFAGFYALGLAYYNLWIPNQDVVLIHRLTVITIMAGIASGLMYPLYYIYTLTVKKVVSCFVTLIGGLFNVLGMYILIKYFGWGVEAVVWTTVVVMTVINFVTNPLYMAHVLKFPKLIFFPNIIRNLISCIALTIVFTFFAQFYMPQRWIALVLTILFYAVVGAAIHLLIVLDRDDWKKIRMILKK